MYRVVPFALLTLSCATLANDGMGDRDLPSVGVGPFRKLLPEEQRGTPPGVLDDAKLQFRDPAVLTLSDDPHTTEMLLYATGNDEAGKDVIYRSHANDARTFYGTSSHAGARPTKVFSASHAWEGAGVRAPSMLRNGGEIWMYYVGDGGIGLARSADGIAFTSSDAPVLAIAGAHGPSVIRADDGFHLFYEIGRQIFESTSASGTMFGAGTFVLGASPPLTRALEPGEKPPFDAVGVGDPCASLRTTSAGRTQLRLLYTGVAADGTTAIGFAARYGNQGALARNASPVFSSANGDVAPAIFEWIDPSAKTEAITMLYAAEGKAGYSAIGAAVAPVSAVLGMPQDFPSQD
jgi:hypothetical protein